eukprot:1878860-Pyramimonas_sp.AAC.1
MFLLFRNSGPEAHSRARSSPPQVAAGAEPRRLPPSELQPAREPRVLLGVPEPAGGGRGPAARVCHQVRRGTLGGPRDRERHPRRGGPLAARNCVPVVRKSSFQCKTGRGRVHWVIHLGQTCPELEGSAPLGTALHETFYRRIMRPSRRIFADKSAGDENRLSVQAGDDAV